MNVERLKRFVSLAKKKKELSAELSDVEADMKLLEANILEDFTVAGVSTMSIDDRVLYIHKQAWAKRHEGVSGAEVVRAMQQAGLEEFTTINHQSLSSELRRLEEDGESIPPELEGLIDFVPTFSIRSRKK